MDPRTLKFGDRIQHPDFGDGTAAAFASDAVQIEWDRRGSDIWTMDDPRWEQVEESI